MAAKFRKIDPRIWSDESFELLPPMSKLVAFNLLTGQSNRIGLFKFSPALGAEQCGMDFDSYGIAIREVCHRLNWRHDAARNVLYIPTWFKYNAPENPKHMKGCLEDLHDVPQTPLLNEFASNTKYIPAHSLDSYGIAMGIALAYQKQEQEQEQEQNTPKAPKGAKAPVEKPGEPHPAKDDELPPGFMRFWSAWPSHERKQGKAKCVRKWKRAKLEPIAEKVIDALERCKVSRQWTKNDGEFIPGPERWLNDTPWLSDPTETCGQPVPDDGNNDPTRDELPWIRNRGGE